MEKKFLSNEQGICPVCGKCNLGWGDMEVDGNYLFYEWECEDCHAQGKEWYKMVFDGHNVILPDGTDENVNDYIVPEV